MTVIYLTPRLDKHLYRELKQADFCGYIICSTNPLSQEPTKVVKRFWNDDLQEMDKWVSGVSLENYWLCWFSNGFIQKVFKPKISDHYLYDVIYDYQTIWTHPNFRVRSQIGFE